MRKLLMILCTLLLVGCGTTKSVKVEQEVGLLQTVKERGYVICGVNSTLPGFSAQDESGSWSG